MDEINIQYLKMCESLKENSIEEALQPFLVMTNTKTNERVYLDGLYIIQYLNHICICLIHEGRSYHSCFFKSYFKLNTINLIAESLLHLTSFEGRSEVKD